MVKYGLSEALPLKTRVANQRYFHSVARNAEQIRVADIVHEFKHKSAREKEKTYIVMPFIPLVDTAPSDKDAKIEKAVRWLATVAPPDGHKLGPLGGGPIVHSIFCDGQAPLVFTDVEALQRFMETGRQRISQYESKTTFVNITGEPLVCIQGDMRDDHFGFDLEGNTVVMGLRSIVWVPQSLGMYAYKSLKGKLGGLPTELGWSGADHQRTMANISYILKMSGGTSLGLDESGRVKEQTNTK
ncbi:hypothetical protein FRB90_005425 [Tulasnella sp. 427]|nr:hypothetical protein FRB90_005425 [Tulasnella sp. 427]